MWQRSWCESTVSVVAKCVTKDEVMEGAVSCRTRTFAHEVMLGSWASEVQFQIWREANRKPKFEFKTSSNGNSSETGMAVESDGDLNSNGIVDGIRELGRVCIRRALILN